MYVCGIAEASQAASPAAGTATPRRERPSAAAALEISRGGRARRGSAKRRREAAQSSAKQAHERLPKKGTDAKGNTQGHKARAAYAAPSFFFDLLLRNHPLHTRPGAL